MRWLEVTTFQNKKEVLICIGPGCRIERSGNPMNKKGAMIFWPDGSRAIETDETFDSIKHSLLHEIEGPVR